MLHILQIAALERSRKIDELQKRLVESEMLRTRYNRKLTMIKDQMRSTTENADQERSINDHSLQLLRDELAQVKQNLAEVTRRESQVSDPLRHYIICLFPSTLSMNENNRIWLTAGFYLFTHLFWRNDYTPLKLLLAVADKLSFPNYTTSNSLVLCLLLFGISSTQSK